MAAKAHPVRLRITAVSLGIVALLASIVFGQVERAAGREDTPPLPNAEAALAHPVVQRSLVQVGFHDLGGTGFNADIWLHDGFVYVGSFGVGGGGCDSRGVKVVDISNPLAPSLGDVLPIPAGSRTSDVKVAAVSTASFQGDLLMNSNEACAAFGSNGIQLWDVTDPLNAQELGRFDTGGVHNAYLYASGDRAYVLLAVPFAEVFGPSGSYPASDLQIIDVTDPAAPVLAGEWTIGRDAGLAFGAPSLGAPGLPPGSDCTPPPSTPDFCRGSDFPAVYLHDVWASADGAVAYLSYWDAGLVTLDISDPTAPALLGVATEPLSDEGNAHNAVPIEGTDIVIVADEDFTLGPWGFVRVFDNTDPANALELGSFATANSLAAPPPDNGSYTVHNLTAVGTTIYAAWYSDGVRVLDATHLSPLEPPTEIASFVPPAVVDPHAVFAPRAQVWGVSVQDEVVYASDINGGLYVLAYDDDLDGCANIQEAGVSSSTGGQRDPAYFWDFMDVPIGLPPERDRAVSVGDIGGVVARFGAFQDPPLTKPEALAQALTPPPPAPAYHAAFDRNGADPSGDPWDLFPPDGTITVGDIGAVVVQFGHTCA